MFRSSLIIAIFILAFPLFCLAQANNQLPSAKVIQSKDYQEIERLEVLWNTINEISDAEGKQRLLAEDSYHIGNDGRFYNKIEDVEIQKSARERKKTLKSTVKFHITDKKIRLFKNVAIVTGLGTTFVTNSGKQRVTGQFRFIHVWEKRINKWQLAIDQTTAVRTPAISKQVIK